jgi:serine O-acetyltransferase
MDRSFLQKLYQSHQACPTCPAPQEVSHFYVELLGALFADFTQLAALSEQEFFQLMERLQKELERILRHNPTKGLGNPAQLAEKLFDALPAICDKLKTMLPRCIKVTRLQKAGEKWCELIPVSMRLLPIV